MVGALDGWRFVFLVLAAVSFVLAAIAPCVATDPRADAPPPKVGHACVYLEVSVQGQLARDSQAYVGHKLLCFGGGDGRRATNETLLIDLPSLATAKLQPRGTPPQERVGHAMALVRHSLMLVGPAGVGVEALRLGPLQPQPELLRHHRERLLQRPLVHHGPLHHHCEHPSPRHPHRCQNHQTTPTPPSSHDAELPSASWSKARSLREQNAIPTPESVRRTF